MSMTYTQSTVEGLIRAAALKGWSAGHLFPSSPPVTQRELLDMEQRVLAEVKEEYLGHVEPARKPGPGVCGQCHAEKQLNEFGICEQCVVENAR